MSETCYFAFSSIFIKNPQNNPLILGFSQSDLIYHHLFSKVTARLGSISLGFFDLFGQFSFLHTNVLTWCFKTYKSMQGGGMNMQGLAVTKQYHHLSVINFTHRSKRTCEQQNGCLCIIGLVNSFIDILFYFASLNLPCASIYLLFHTFTKQNRGCSPPCGIAWPFLISQNVI